MDNREQSSDLVNARAEEKRLLELELHADDKKDGPMRPILETLSSLLGSSEVTQLFELYRGEEKRSDAIPFVFRDHQYLMWLSIFQQEEDMCVRIGVGDPNPPKPPVGHALSAELQLAPDEIAFIQYNFTDYKGEVYVTPATASADTSPRGFAKSLILSSPIVIRTVMELMNIPQVEASIGDAATDASGEFTNWSSTMAKRMGYKRASDSDSLATYTYN